MSPAGDAAERPLDLVHPLVVGRRVNGLGDAAAREEVLDLADRDHRQPRRLDPIQQRVGRGRHREVAPVGGALEGAGRTRRTGAR